VRDYIVSFLKPSYTECLGLYEGRRGAGEKVGFFRENNTFRTSGGVFIRKKKISVRKRFCGSLSGFKEVAG